MLWGKILLCVSHLDQDHVCGADHLIELDSVQNSVNGLSSVKSRPNSEEAGPEVVPPFNETWAAMETLVDRGLVRGIGVSNFSPEKIQTLLKTARIRPAVNQVRPVTLKIYTHKDKTGKKLAWWSRVATMPAASVFWSH